MRSHCWLSESNGKITAKHFGFVLFVLCLVFMGQEAVHSFSLHICKPPYIVMLLIVLFMEVSLVFQEQNFANPMFVF